MYAQVSPRYVRWTRWRVHLVPASSGTEMVSTQWRVLLPSVEPIERIRAGPPTHFCHVGRRYREFRRPTRQALTYAAACTCDAYRVPSSLPTWPVPGLASEGMMEYRGLRAVLTKRRFLGTLAGSLRFLRRDAHHATHESHGCCPVLRATARDGGRRFAWPQRRRLVLSVGTI